MNNNGDVGRLSNFSLAPKPSITDHYRVLIYNPVRAAKIRDQLSLLYHTTRKSVCLTPSCKRIPGNFRYLSSLYLDTMYQFETDENHFLRIFGFLILFPSWLLLVLTRVEEKKRKKGNGSLFFRNLLFFLSTPMNFQNGNAFYKAVRSFV